MQADRFHRLRSVLQRRQPDLTVVMDQVNKARNFSAILRSCDAVGVLQAHAVPPEKGLDLSPVTSAGSEKWIRVQSHEDIAIALQELRSEGFRIVAAHPTPEARDYRSVDFTEPTAILLGAELHGVSPRALATADETVAIPMLGMVGSLNVSVAAALFLFEAMTQRERAGMYDSSRIPASEFRRILFEWAHPRIAARLRERGDPYPPLSEDGEFIGPIRGTVGFRESEGE